MSGKPKTKEVHKPLLYKDVVSPWEIGVASRTNGTRLCGFYRVILQPPLEAHLEGRSCTAFMRINQALLCSKNHPKSHWHKQMFASCFCSAFLVGWRGILLCVNSIREFTVMEKHLSDQGWLPRLVTVAWQHVPSGVSQVTSTHIFLAKPKPMLVPKFNWVQEAQFFQVVRRARPDIGEQPNLCHIHFPAEDAPSSPVSLTRDEEVLTGNLGRCAWSLKPKQGNIFRVQSEVD